MLSTSQRRRLKQQALAYVRAMIDKDYETRWKIYVGMFRTREDLAGRKKRTIEGWKEKDQYFSIVRHLPESAYFTATVNPQTGRRAAAAYIVVEEQTRTGCKVWPWFHLDFVQNKDDWFCSGYQTSRDEDFGHLVE